MKEGVTINEGHVSWRHRRALGRWSGALALLLAAAACTTPYQPMGNMGGFTEQRLAADRYTVEFRGNGNTSADLVANMYLYRCAELTLKDRLDVFRSQRPEDASTGSWGEAMSAHAGDPDGEVIEFRSGGAVYYVPVYTGGHTSTAHRMTGVVRMGRYADVPSDVMVWDARAVMKTLEPVVKGGGRQPALPVAQVARLTMVAGRGQAQAVGSGTSLDSLRRLLPKP